MALDIPWSLIYSYLEGTINKKDATELESWRNESELNELVFKEILSNKELTEAILTNKWKNKKAVFNKILSRIEIPNNKISINKYKFYIGSAAAACVLLLIGLGFGKYYNNKTSVQTKAKEAYTFIYSPRGQRTRVILPDKTKVWLNSETSLKYAVSFNDEVREVNLEGEAFFEVEKNPQKPFWVNASELKVKVYGTSFNIKAYPTDKNVEATLIEGKLSVIPKDNNEEIMLKPKERFILKKVLKENENSLNTEDKKEKKGQNNIEKATEYPKMMLAKNVNTAEEILWKDGKLLFNDEKFSDLAIKLERWYDVKIHFKDEKIKDFRFTGVFDRETINQAMDALKISSGQTYDYQIVFRDIYIHSK